MFRALGCTYNIQIRKRLIKTRLHGTACTGHLRPPQARGGCPEAPHRGMAPRPRLARAGRPAAGRDRRRPSATAAAPSSTITPSSPPPPAVSGHGHEMLVSSCCSPAPPPSPPSLSSVLLRAPRSAAAKPRRRRISRRPYGPTRRSPSSPPSPLSISVDARDQF